MSLLASTREGIGRVEGDELVLLNIRFTDLGQALQAGLDLAELQTVPERRRIPLDQARLLATIPRPSKIWAVGFAYADHRAEVGYTAEVDDPVIFFKAPSSVTATHTPILLPPVAPDKVDYEGELAVVIGARAVGIDAQHAMAAIAGFTICNDVSARDVQKGLLPGRAADVSTAKSFDTFTPMGPWLATLDEFRDPADLRLRTWVDGELRQDASTAQLIYSIPNLIAYLSHQTTLEPGDVILTGTPAGVGHKQGKFLRPGSQVRIEVEGIGVLENTCAGS
jgi:2-keto-4-pentenoate hydratase/2-oxohepta-3-ene-1,7-dioic acid hydratase in catechol pathway